MLTCMLVAIVIHWTTEYLRVVNPELQWLLEEGNNKVCGLFFSALLQLSLAILIQRAVRAMRQAWIITDCINSLCVV